MQIRRLRWQIKDLLASLAGPAAAVSCYRVSELDAAALECERDEPGDFLLTLVLVRGSQLRFSGYTTPGQVGSAGAPSAHGEGRPPCPQVQAFPCPCPQPEVQAGGSLVGPRRL